MTRLLLYLFGKKDFEECKSCETLKQQLALANDEKKQLTETLLNIFKPKEEHINTPVELKVEPSRLSFSARRAAAEASSRASLLVKRDSNVLAKPDADLVGIRITPPTVEQLEKELEVENERTSG